MIADSRSTEPRISAPSPFADVLPPPVSGAPTGAPGVSVEVGVVDDDDDEGLDVVGLDVVGLDVVGLDAVGLDVVGLDFVGLDAVGLDADGSVAGAAVVGEPPAMTGGDDAEAATIGLLDEFPVVVSPPPISQKASSDEAKMKIARTMARRIPVRRRLEPDPAVSGALSDIAEAS